MSRAIKSSEDAETDGGRHARMVEDEPASAPLPAPGEPITDDLTLLRVVHTGPLATSVQARGAGGELLLLKVLHPSFSAREDVVRRVTRLVAQQSGVSHPHIAGPSLTGTAGSRLFLGRPWLEGKSLRETVRDHGLTARTLVQGLCGVLSALSEAHRQGSIHGSLKPENIVLRPGVDGASHWIVCDFGHGRLLRPAAGSAISAEGVICGAPAYLAPEQAAGAEIDGRTDVYSLGAILHELLTGEPPFQSFTARGLLEAHRSEPLQSLRKRFPDRAIPRELEVVCAKALEKSVEARYASARAMAEALRDALELMRGLSDVPLQMPARPSSEQTPPAAHDRLTLPNEPLRSKTKIWLGAGLIALAGAALLLWPREGSAPERTTSQADGLEDARALLARGAAEAAVQQLEALRVQRADEPRVLRLLGEALIRAGRAPEGRAVLARYLEVARDAPDRQAVEAMMADAPPSKRP